jgi:uncharacterized protein YacL (UPF0231 family)
MSKLLKSKFLLGVMIVAIMFVGAAVVSTEEASADCSITTTLRVGSSGAEVMCLQALVGATADGAFGPMTKAAVMAYQASHGLAADGVVGPMTRAVLMAGGAVSGNFPAGCTSSAGYSSTTGVKCDSTSSSGLPAGCTSTAGYSSTTGAKCDGSTTGGSDDNGPLTGEAGSVESYELMSFSNEEVGEDEEDVEVAGLEIEVDDGSDLDITAVRLDFAQVGANNDNFDEYVTEVSLWLDGEEVGRADAEDFDEDNGYEKTMSLDGAVCRAGETCELTVALTGVNNIDSNDDGETWTVDFEQIRFADAEGTVISEDPGTGTETWTVELFATATDVELKASLTDDEDDINDSHVVDVDDTNDTEGIEVLAFDMEVEGDSDIDVDSMEVDFTSTETTGNDPADIVTQGCLWMDGEELDCQTFTDAGGDSADTLVFDDLDLALEAGETYSFVVSVDAISTGDALDNGDTITATLDVSETDGEDESGEELAGGDLTGSAVGNAIAFFDAGIMAKFISTDYDISAVDGGADVVNFELVFDVTAFDTDAYLDASSITDEAGGATYQNILGNGFVATAELDSGADDAANSTLKVEDGTTERFTLTVSGVGTGAFAQAVLESILWATTAIDGDQLYTFDMGDYESSSVFVSGS